MLHSLYPGGFVRSVGDLSSALETQVKGVRVLDSNRERQAPAAEKTAGKVIVAEGARYPRTGRPTVSIGVLASRQHPSAENCAASRIVWRVGWGRA